MTLDKALSWFTKIWIGLVIVLTLMSFAGTIVSAPTVWTGIMRVWDEVSPFNIKYYITMALLLSPAWLGLAWRDKRREKRVQ